MRKKLLALFLGGILTMTLLNGCVESNKNSEEEILSNLTDFIDMFPSEDLTYLYDKKGSGSLEPNDLGTWVVSSYLYYYEGDIRKSVGCNLFFNRNLREARGRFYIGSRQPENENEEEEAYTIYYDKAGIHLLEDVTDEEVLNKFNNFKMMFEYISLDKEYISNLELDHKYYNAEVPIYGLTYKLSLEDKNVNKIKEIYPEFQVKEEQIKLEFEGSCDPNSNIGYQTIVIQLDKDNKVYLKTNFSFNNSDFSADLFKKE